MSERRGNSFALPSESSVDGDNPGELARLMVRENSSMKSMLILSIILHPVLLGVKVHDVIVAHGHNCGAKVRLNLQTAKYF